MCIANDDLYNLRHSLAHVLGQAVLTLWPNTKLAFGPPVDNGCYYDFDFDLPISTSDLEKIKEVMITIIKEGQGFSRFELPCDEALRMLAETKQTFKAEYCAELIDSGEKVISFYQNGNFVDMCAGPHLNSTSEIPIDCFCLDSIAGAYWRGKESNPQLTRIYCLAFSKREDLEEFLRLRVLAQERDHRKLGKELDLFVLSDEVGPGLPLWTPNGTAIRDALEDFAKEVEMRAGYVRVSTPHLAKEQLYLESGHLPMYEESMFPPMCPAGESKYYVKPMNCPHHHILYRSLPRSYRELPIRYAEYGAVYRYEASGSLSGLLRVRSIAQNDAHIYCTQEQLKEEVKATVRMTLDYYKKFRFEGVQMRFSQHDPSRRDDFIDNPSAWQHTERIMREILEELDADYYDGPGEAAFYGPKFDFQAKTALGREETISTTQLDFGQPERFKLRYRGEDGQEHMPYVVHRAPLGAHERFIAFLIEHFGGAFPTWMAPIQTYIIPVNQEVLSYCKEIADTLRGALFRVEVDASHDSLNKKIRFAATQKFPNTIIIGSKEQAARSVTLRRYSTAKQVSMSLENYIGYLESVVKDRLMDNFEEDTTSCSILAS